MTPAEHYTEAERWLSAAVTIPGTQFVLVDHETYTHEQCAEIAQVHATLATVDPTLVGMRRPVPPVPRFEPGETP